jgi:nitrogen regulatory protein P-II 1
MAKLVIAFIRREKLEEVKRRLEEIGVTGMTVIPVYGRGEERGIELTYRGKPMTVELIPRIQLEVIVEDDMAGRVVDAIASAAYTGRPGDGRIIVVPLEANIKVREYVKERG